MKEIKQSDLKQAIKKIVMPLVFEVLKRGDDLRMNQMLNSNYEQSKKDFALHTLINIGSEKLVDIYGKKTELEIKTAIWNSVSEQEKNYINKIWERIYKNIN